MHFNPSPICRIRFLRISGSICPIRSDMNHIQYYDYWYCRASGWLRDMNVFGQSVGGDTLWNNNFRNIYTICNKSVRIVEFVIILPSLELLWTLFQSFAGNIVVAYSPVSQCVLGNNYQLLPCDWCDVRQPAVYSVTRCNQWWSKNDNCQFVLKCFALTRST